MQNVNFFCLQQSSAKHWGVIEDDIAEKWEDKENKMSEIFKAASSFVMFCDIDFPVSSHFSALL